MEKKPVVFRMVVVSLTAVVISVNDTNYGPLIPVLQSDLHIGSEQVTVLLATTFFLGMVGASLLGGRLADRYGARIVMLASLLTLIGGEMLLPFSPLPFPLYFWIGMMRCVVGIGTGIAFIGGTRIMSTMGKHADIAQGLYGSASILGPAFGLLFTPMLLKRLDWQGTFFFWGCVGVAFYMLWAWVPDEPSIQTNDNAQGSHGSSLAVLKSPVLWMIGLTYMGTAGLGNAIFAWLTLYFLHRYGISLMLAGILSSLGLFIGIFCRPVGGVLLHRFTPIQIIRAACIMLCLGVVFLVLPVSSLPLACGGILFVALGTTLPHAAIFNLAAAVGNVSRLGAGRAQGLMLIAAAPALFFASPLIGSLAYLDNFTVAFSLAGFLFGGVAVLASWLAGPLLVRAGVGILEQEKRKTSRIAAQIPFWWSSSKRQHTHAWNAFYFFTLSGGITSKTILHYLAVQQPSLVLHSARYTKQSAAQSNPSIKKAFVLS